MTPNLSKRLRHHHLHPLVTEISDSPGILLKVSRGPALVSAVKERNQLASLHDLADLSPLRLAGVEATGILSLGVEDEYCVRLAPLHTLQQGIKIECHGAVVEVGIWLDISEASLHKDVSVIDPGWVRESRGLAAQLLSEELCAQPQRPSSPDALDCDGSP